MNPVDVIVVGQALNDRGFVAFNASEGLGLNTFGFVWPCEGIWATTNDTCAATVWTAVAQASPVNTEICVDLG